MGKGWREWGMIISTKITGWAPGRPQKKVERSTGKWFSTPKKTRSFCQPIFISHKPKPFKVFFCPQKCPLIISNKDVQGEISKDLVWSWIHGGKNPILSLGRSWHPWHPWLLRDGAPYRGPTASQDFCPRSSTLQFLGWMVGVEKQFWEVFCCFSKKKENVKLITERISKL